MSLARTSPPSRRTSPVPSPGRQPVEETAEERASRRIQGQSPEFGLWVDPPRKKPTNTRMNTQAQQTETSAAAAPVVFVPVAPRTPTSFHGELYEDVEDWIQHYERVARHNGWTAAQRLQNLYFSLEGTARRWFENHEASLTSWDLCAAELRRTFTSLHRRQQAEDLLQTRTQAPNESVTSFVEDVLRLCARADPQATEEKKLRFLMRGVKNEIFGGLVRNPPTTVDGFVTEASNIERALSARAVHCQRLAGVSTVAAPTTTSIDVAGAGIESLRQIIREVVREEIKMLLPAADRPALLSVAEVVREEVQRALQPEAPVAVPVTEEPTLSYAAAARRPPPAHQYSSPPRRDAPTPHYLRRQDNRAQYVRPEQPAPRKTDIWRTADRRPLCYHCGEADHVYRGCPYRRLGLRGFHPNDPRPRYGERPRDIDEYLRRSPSSAPSPRRESRSPSPRRSASPAPRPAERACLRCVVGKTKCGNAWRWRCRRRPK
ncbi:unnamed protein product [Ixodes hexagonus]